MNASEVEWAIRHIRHAPKPKRNAAQTIGTYNRRGDSPSLCEIAQSVSHQPSTFCTFICCISVRLHAAHVHDLLARAHACTRSGQTVIIIYTFFVRRTKCDMCIEQWAHTPIITEITHSWLPCSGLPLVPEPSSGRYERDREVEFTIPRSSVLPANFARSIRFIVGDDGDASLHCVRNVYAIDIFLFSP